MEDIDVYQKFKNQFDQRLMYASSYDPDEAPIITLMESVSSWNIGDEIVIASTDYDPRRSEVFTIMDCGNICDINQLKLNRPAKFNHWGRIDKRTGLDQRAEVGLLSRNVRFYGSETDECEYAESRCSGEAEDGPCPGNRVPKADIAEPEGGFPDLYCYDEETRHNCESKNFCYVLLENEPEGGKKDFHGANIFVRGGTRNVHLRLVSYRSTILK